MDGLDTRAAYSGDKLFLAYLGFGMVYFISIGAFQI
jgi:hypothetical protein